MLASGLWKKIAVGSRKRNWTRHLNWAAVCFLTKHWCTIRENFEQVFSSTLVDSNKCDRIGLNHGCESREVDGGWFHHFFWPGLLIHRFLVRYFGWNDVFPPTNWFQLCWQSIEGACCNLHLQLFLTLKWWFWLAPSKLKPWFQILTRQFNKRLKNRIVHFKVVRRNSEKVVFILCQSLRQKKKFQTEEFTNSGIKHKKSVLQFKISLKS